MMSKPLGLGLGLDGRRAGATKRKSVKKCCINSGGSVVRTPGFHCREPESVLGRGN